LKVKCNKKRNVCDEFESQNNVTRKQNDTRGMRTRNPGANWRSNPVSDEAKPLSRLQKHATNEPYPVV